MSKKPPLPEHVIRAMQRDDGYIITEAAKNRPAQHVVYIRTTEGYKPLCTLSYAEFRRLYDEDYIQPAENGKWKLCEKLPIDGDEHKL